MVLCFFTNNLAEKTVRKNCRLLSDPPWGIAVIYRTMTIVIYNPFNLLQEANGPEEDLQSNC